MVFIQRIERRDYEFPPNCDRPALGEQTARKGLALTSLVESRAVTCRSADSEGAAIGRRDNVPRSHEQKRKYVEKAAVVPRPEKLECRAICFFKVEVARYLVNG